MMKLYIFNVGHGFCAYLVHGNNNVMLFDCGRDENFYPSTKLKENGCTGIERFIITNYDEDHIKDLPNLVVQLPISVVTSNNSINTEQLRALKLKSGPLSPAMEKLLAWKSGHTAVRPSGMPDFSGLQLTTFHTRYPEFDDTNNLSLVSFIHYDGMGIVIPGDIEKKGWKKLLEQTSFQEHLGRVNIFVASHHGRESGYEEAVFEHCNPDVVIISDGPIQYNSQNTDYASHAKGITWNKNQTRYVLTTRKDGHLRITKERSKGFFISAGISF